MNRKYVPSFQKYVCVGARIVYGLAYVYCISPAKYLLTILDVITGQIGLIKQRTAIEPASHAHELRHGHTPRQWVRSRVKYFAVHLDLGSIRFVTPKNADRIEGLKMDRFIPCQNIW